MSFALGVALLAVVTAVTCALPGTYVVLRRSSMLVDAISHAVLPGIVLGYLLTRDLDSPVLILGAALAGMLVVLGAEWLGRTGLLTGDAPQGLIFPALFSIGVILVTLNAANVHLDTHAVLVGDLNLAAWDQLEIAGLALGPRYLYLMLGMLVLNAVVLALLHRTLTLTTFDPVFARTIGIRSGLVNAVFMLLVALTVTAAYNAAGAILVIALVVIPPATARLLTDRLPVMLGFAAGIAAAGALAGFWLAYVLDAATSAGMATFYGLAFGVVLLATRLRRREGREMVRNARASTPGAPSRGLRRLS
ncbi:metal ABC transporter permease [Serinibacter salmoneus]|uniref:Manganese/zinc/iron transport system permease protein n=1 Tax=Serinibacter salmoneus TaxID=556530 RepID=A0A2A9CXW1_9MICO|nr:metal ABC transporter permease [Serinibacter salmoneus]PFG19277.1 manganese/zinc/iron transport system permease protein [Serinibacter salmoneus]